MIEKLPPCHIAKGSYNVRLMLLFTFCGEFLQMDGLKKQQFILFPKDLNMQGTMGQIKCKSYIYSLTFYVTYNTYQIQLCWGIFFYRDTHNSMGCG